jgi:hypothetical protein
MCVHKVRSKDNPLYLYSFYFLHYVKLELNFHIWVFCVKIILSTNFVGVKYLTLLV